MIVTWQVEDGYCGGRPQSTYIPEEHLADCHNEEERQEQIRSIIQDEFESRISWYIKDIEEEE